MAALQGYDGYPPEPCTECPECDNFLKGRVINICDWCGHNASVHKPNQQAAGPSHIPAFKYHGMPPRPGLGPQMGQQAPKPPAPHSVFRTAMAAPTGYDPSGYPLEPCTECPECDNFLEGRVINICDWCGHNASVHKRNQQAAVMSYRPAASDAWVLRYGLDAQMKLRADCRNCDCAVYARQSMGNGCGNPKCRHLSTDHRQVIEFCEIDRPYYEFSNSYVSPFLDAEGKQWATSEHYFQARKFFPHAPWLMEQIRRLPTPRDAFELAQQHRAQMRPDWHQGESLKVMKEAVHRKFVQNNELLVKLLDTGDAYIVEHTTNDAYWGDGGGNGRGRNELGKALMQLRDELNGRVRQPIKDPTARPPEPDRRQEAETEARRRREEELTREHQRLEFERLRAADQAREAERARIAEAERQKKDAEQEAARLQQREADKAEARRRHQQLADEAARVREQEAEVARRMEELRVREQEVERRKAEVEEMAKLAPLLRATPSSDSSEATKLPSEPSRSDEATKLPSEPSRSRASSGSAKSDHAAFLSKLRITKDEVAYSTDATAVLGEGSFGIVYRGLLRGATRVAVKAIKGDVTPETVAMFLKEIAVWDGLNQRNVLPLLAFCESPPLLISELTEGSMRSRLDALRWDQAVGLRYLRGVAAGMAYLHSYKVLHGDLKCANIMIDHDIPKIADFGLAKVRSHLSLGSTRGDGDATGGGGGTPPFMAPELWRGGKLRTPVDVYAFAMVCYEVTDEGGYPFEGLWMAAVSEAVLRGDRPERPDNADDKMWALMERMWAQSAADRPTFVEVCAEMERW